MSGLEFFDQHGNAIQIANPVSQVSAQPTGVNELPGMEDDPRTVDKLVDGHYYTSDAVYMWLAPFTPGQRHKVFVRFDQPYGLSRIRIWNFNSSRAHSQRGAR